MFVKLVKNLLNDSKVLKLKCISNYSQHKSVSNISENTTYFITTPIFYVNSVPHIGHLYSAVIADTFHRFHRMLGITNTIFSTGTDEHGIKIQRVAEMKSIDPKVLCDQISNQFKSLFELTDIGFTRFIRTTDELHIKSVQTFWKTLMNNGFIYKSSYEGWYCASDETFVTESQIVLNENKVKVSAESGNPVEWSAEDNYIFKLSQFREPLLLWINSGETIRPSNFADILRHEIEKGLKDISVSRPKSRVHWGIEVPNDCTQIIYVWFDALINYLTVSGYPQNADHLWPPDCQVIGKDILKFHGIYWPAFLMAAGLKPPVSLLCHSHWLKDDTKMSKSKGNVVDPFRCVNDYTSDGFRYFLLRQGSLHSDSNFNEEKVRNYLNSELADTFGNLLSRSTSKAINKKQIFPNFCLNDIQVIETNDSEIINSIKDLSNICKNHYFCGNFHLVINEVMNCLRFANVFFNDTKPWVLAKHQSEEHRLQSVLCITMEALRVCALILQPIVPNISNDVLNKLNISDCERNWINTENTFNSNTNQSKDLSLNSKKSIIFAKVL